MVRASHYDVIIVGGGINGAGIARDAAMRGLKVLLIEKGELGCATTSASTRLIHGGLRYLERFEFGLVRESLREREILLKIAPDLVKALAITIPIYKHNKRGRLMIRAGMMLYDLLSWGKSLPRHRMLSRAKTLERWPGLNPQGLFGSALYYDAQVEFPERLVVAIVQSAREFGAEVLTHTRVTSLIVEDRRVSGVEFVGEDDRKRFADTSVLINAAGPWIDQVLESVKSPKLIGGTKGSHIVVPPFAGAPANAIYLEARSDGRPIFITPWNKLYLIGTTDVRFEGDPDEVRCEDWEIDYLLSETNLAIPDSHFTRDNIVEMYSGVRPLPFQSTTRRHFIREHPQLPNLLSIVGGKLTTYRNLAEQTVDRIFSKLGTDAPACKTDKIRL
jgi:glycerol-3-phosphate dehydrogenase